MKRHIFSICIIAIFLSSCTTIGIDEKSDLKSINFGKPETIRVVALLDSNITANDARELLKSAWDNESGLYGINFEIIEFVPWKRPAFTHEGIFSKLTEVKLQPGQDRIMAFIGRDFGDFVYGIMGIALPLPEVLGEVDDLSGTHGFIVAKTASLNQIFITPTAALRHELYHMLGCPHSLTKEKCYHQIARLKKAKTGDFFPSWSFEEKKIIISREEANSVFKNWRLKHSKDNNGSSGGKNVNQPSANENQS